MPPQTFDESNQQKGQPRILPPQTEPPQQASLNPELANDGRNGEFTY